MQDLRRLRLEGYGIALLLLGGAACDSTTSAGGDADGGDVSDVEEATPDDAGETTDVEETADEVAPDVADGEDVGNGEDGETTHEELLGGLGVDTTPDEPLDPEGGPLRDGYHPLGRAHATLLPKLETYLLRYNHAGRHQYLLDDARAGWADLYSTIDDSWATASPQKGVVGADVDGDGFDEIAIVFYAPTDTALRLLVIDWTPAGFVEHEATIATGITSRPSDATRQPTMAAGDLDGDGRAELIVGYSTLYVVEDLEAGFTVTSREYPSTDIYVAAGELDGDGRDEFIVTYQDGSYAYCDIFDGDLSAPRLRADEVLHARGLDGGHTYRAHADVRMADIDGDGLDEIVFLGDRRDYDAWNVTARDDARHELAWLPLFYWAAEDDCLARGFAVMDYDGDGRENEIFASFALVRYDPGEGTVSTIHALLPGTPPFMVCASPGIVNVWGGDVDGDGADELLYYWDGAFRVDGRNATGGYANERVITGGGYDASSRIAAANIDDDSPVLAYRGEHELLFTDPTPLAVLGCPPYHDGIGQNVEGSGTTFGRSTAAGVEEATSMGVSVGFSIGYEASDPFGIASASFKVTFEQAFDWSSTRGVEVEKSIAYTSGPDEDKVIFTAVPFDVYYYDIVSSPVPEEVGTVMSINVPRELQTLSVSREFYNANNGEFPDIDASVLRHTIGDVSSYPTRADRDALLADGGLYSIATPVGVGSGSIAVTVSRSESVGEGTAYDFSVTAEAEVGAGGVTFGTSAGFHYGWEHTVTNTEATFYEGTVGDIPSASYTPGRAYTFGLFAHPFVLGGQEFTVVEYWVE